MGPDLIVRQVRLAWGLDVHHADYAPVGFGSHHWWLTGPGDQRWFATVDDLRMGDRSRATLDGALLAAFLLRETGLEFVVAPLPRPNGDLTEALSDRHVLAVYPHVDGEAPTYGRFESHERRQDVIGRLVAIHRSTDEARGIAPVDSLAIPQRADLDNTLATMSRGWDSGPFAHGAHALLRSNAAGLATALAAYDDLAGRIRATSDTWVITHGEPHRGNTIVNDSGVHLIDWETARIAPPERDLWALIDEDARCRVEYTELSGRELNDDALDLYRRWWDLCEVSLYTAELRKEHGDTPETRIAWQCLRDHLAKAIAE